MWRWTMTLLLVATLSLASTGCPQREPVVPPPQPAPTDPAVPPDRDYVPGDTVPPPEEPG
jgi:hypothetical protein